MSDYGYNKTGQHTQLAFLLEGARNQLMMSLFPNYSPSLERLDAETPIGRGSRRYSQQAARLARVSAPYVIKIDPSVGGKLLVLNREYKPIGCGGRSWGDGYHARYLDFQYAIIQPSLELMEWMRANMDEVHADSHWYLYNDLNPPWDGRKHAERQIRLIEGLLDQLAPGWLK